MWLCCPLKPSGLSLNTPARLGDTVMAAQEAYADTGAYLKLPVTLRDYRHAHHPIRASL